MSEMERDRASQSTYFFCHLLSFSAAGHWPTILQSPDQNHPISLSFNQPSAPSPISSREVTGVWTQKALPLLPKMKTKKGIENSK